MDLRSAEIERVLRKAGWRRGRRVDTARWRTHYGSVGLHMHEAAELFLGEFGGLKFKDRGPGITSARQAFELDPLLCDGEDDRFESWGDTIGRSLFPIGDLDGGRFFLGIDERRKVYVVSDFLLRYDDDEVDLEGLILGVMPKPVDGAV